MAQSNDSRLEVVERFFSGTGSTYDFIVQAATFGIDGLWKRRILGQIPSDAERILDLACGTGILTCAVAKRFPRAHVVGVELRDEYLQIARKKLERLGLQNVEFVLSRAEDYESSKPFDAVISSYLAKYADLKLLTPLTKSMLKENGLLLMHDFTFPPKAYLVRVWRTYFWLMQRLGSPLFPAWQEIFYGLPRLIEHTRWLQDLPAALQEHQFKDIRVEHLTLYGSAMVTARK